MQNGQHIRVRGARQNNLRGLDLELPINHLTVVTGLSGSGKSSLAFDTIYGEGQRRYMETFSPYARQFLERMDKPRVDSIEGVPPAIAVQATNRVKSSRSTVGTMTGICDYLKLLWPRIAQLYCLRCGKPVRKDTPATVWDAVRQSTADTPNSEVLICFPLPLPASFSLSQTVHMLRQQGFLRIWQDDRVLHLEENASMLKRAPSLFVVQDRILCSTDQRRRFLESCESAFHYGKGNIEVVSPAVRGATVRRWRFSGRLHCADCDISYREPSPALFSFNNPLGACPKCRGFGRTIEIDYDRCLPDRSLTLAQGVVKPWQSGMSRECQDDLLRFCRKRQVPVDVPFERLAKQHQDWVSYGDAEYGKDDAHRWPRAWYGIKGFFAWLEGRAYKMHVRVFLSRYRAYRRCSACGGGRFIPEALHWKVDRLTLVDFYALSITTARQFLEANATTRCDDRITQMSRSRQDPTALLAREALARVNYLIDVGLGYLTLDRQSRTLSGGEVERVNLTTCLGTSLVNTLFVLDEPSIGLHPRDTGQLIGVLHRLRDHGNTLLVVEHEESVIRAADHVVDLGPAQGEAGGRIVFQGSPRSLLRCRASLTADYLSGRKGIPVPPKHRPVSQVLRIVGASENNLKQIDAAIPLHAFVCVTGVSGSGKSTLIEKVLYDTLQKRKGKNAEEPGRCQTIRGTEQIEDVVLVDQSPIGRTTRSNPVVYSGAFDPIRDLFAAADEARQHGIRAGDFSFNAGDGRCERCGGNGFERVEMQFLSDVYLRCPDCDGKRFKPHILDIHYRGRSVADVLEMTVNEACAFFAGHAKIVSPLQLLQDVGLGYLRLGQSVPTLSGGESQRLKIVGHLLERGRNHAGRGTLFLFDEPTTGLHFDDIRMLIAVFNRLVDEGHSVVIIEHNMDVVKCADWVIDLGPEAGEAGGRIVASGTPEQLARCAESHTGQALKPLLEPGTRGTQSTNRRAIPRPDRTGSIRIIGAREHNLKDISVDIPRDKLVVVTGISGSGKSTLAFDILFAEGQRRFLDSMSAYARQFIEQLARPDVDHIEGIPPSAAIEQRVTRGGRKSTVATVTEAYHFIRLLFARVGVQQCPRCGVDVEKQSSTAIVKRLATQVRRGSVTLLAPVLRGRKGFGMAIADWAREHGYTALRADGKLVDAAKFQRLDRYREHDIDVVIGTLSRRQTAAEWAARVREALQVGKGQVLAVSRDQSETMFSTERSCPKCGQSFEELDPKLFSFHSPRGWCPACHGYGTRVVIPEDATEEESLERASEQEEAPCETCGGLRLNARALSVRLPVWNLGIADICSQSVARAISMFGTLKLGGREASIARDIMPQIRERLHFLNRVGLGYLSLDRGAHTLSGGESQRIRLAAQLGSNLRGVLYVLDEPTIGLHARDNERLLSTLETLKARGNSLVVVEHDDMTMRRADHIIDLGPGAGVNGGRVIAQGSLAELRRHPESITGQCLRTPMRHPVRGSRRAVGPRLAWLSVGGASVHNLKRVTVRFPLARFICVTGVSGSGKSTLVRDVLVRAVSAVLSGEPVPGDACRELKGIEGIRSIREVDQSPIGRTPRSTPATYTGVFDEIRQLYARTAIARMRGYSASRFSYNSPGGGRCPVCEGQGRIKVIMSFLPDVFTPCEACGGTRYSEETLDVTFRERSIAQVLAMSVDEATTFFQAQPKIHHALELMQQTGLGYLTLGQASPTLSGGEAQRLKLVTELARTRGFGEPEPSGGPGRHDPHAVRPSGPGALFVLEEPTIGLHMADISKLVDVLHRLVDAGQTVVVIEHNLDLIAEADWIIDLGPEGGEGGGAVVVAGTPEAVARCKNSHTGRFLARHLSNGVRQSRQPPAIGALPSNSSFNRR